MTEKIFGVSELNHYIKYLLDQTPALSQIFVKGELSNYKVYPSGHHYFSMKDPDGALKCVMFRGAANKLRFRPENGMKVLALGRVTVFPRDGAYQLYCEELRPDGVGDLHVAFEQLKEKLRLEGLFDPARKKPLPKFPEKIAIITSSAGAAVRDMLRILGKRYPLAKAILLPVRVQGEMAPSEIAGAIAYANRHKIADLIITGRGGGSIEDLWAFNDERVARAIAASCIPIISAVGHEPDVTISDFVADLRAATPSNAAELAVPDLTELFENLGGAEIRLRRAMESQLQILRRRLLELSQNRVMVRPQNYIEDRRQILDHIQSQLFAIGRHYVSTRRERYIRLAASLDALSPLSVLGRGYAIAKFGDAIVKKPSDVKPGDKITLCLKKGEISCRVEENGSV